jgi:hypothetical protein
MMIDRSARPTPQQRRHLRSRAGLSVDMAEMLETKGWFEHQRHQQRLQARLHIFRTN